MQILGVWSGHQYSHLEPNRLQVPINRWAQTINQHALLNDRLSSVFRKDGGWEGCNDMWMLGETRIVDVT